MSIDTNKMYDIAFSVAGEQKSFAEEIKSELEKRGVSCWIYTEKEAEQITDLPPFYENLFTRRCTHAVPIVSKEYLTKPYTDLERQFIISKSMREPRYVIPIQYHEGVKLPGMASTYGYIPWKNRSPQEIAQIIIKYIRGEENKRSAKASEQKPNFYVPQPKKTFNPITERKLWIKYISDELKQRAHMVGSLEMDDDDEGSHHKILFVFNGKTLFSIRIIKGGFGGDNGLAFGFDYGHSSGKGMNAWGEFKVNEENNEIVLDLHSGGFSIDEKSYVKDDLVDALWSIITKQIDEENKR